MQKNLFLFNRAYLATQKCINFSEELKTSLKILLTLFKDSPSDYYEFIEDKPFNISLNDDDLYKAYIFFGKTKRELGIQFRGVDSIYFTSLIQKIFHNLKRK